MPVRNHIILSRKNVFLLFFSAVSSQVSKKTLGRVVREQRSYVTGVKEGSGGGCSSAACVLGFHLTLGSHATPVRLSKVAWSSLMISTHCTSACDRSALRKALHQLPRKQVATLPSFWLIEPHHPRATARTCRSDRGYPAAKFLP